MAVQSAFVRTPRGDALSDVVNEMRLESAAYRRIDLSAPWALDYDEGGRGVHLVLEGRVTLVGLDERGRETREPHLDLVAGDLVLLPTGRPHRLRAPGTPPRAATPIARVLGRSAACPVRHGGGGKERAAIVCGQFFVERAAGEAFLRALPAVLILPGRAGSFAPAVRPLLEALVTEVTTGGPGSGSIIARLSDALVVSALRAHALAGDARGFVGGLADPRLRTLLADLHRTPERPWTVAAMARACGMSRAGFAAHFHDVLLTPPMRYVTMLRMRRAERLLSVRGARAGEVATAVGYRSEAAFSTAFRRHAGVGPATYRRQNLPAFPRT